MQSEFGDLVGQLRSIMAGMGTRQEKARRAASAIGQAGPYRWVGLYDVGPTDIEVIGWAGPSAPSHPTFSRNQGLNGAAVVSGQSIIVQDVKRDPRYLSTLGSTRAEMIMPVRPRPGGEVVGTIDVESEQVNSFADRDRALLSACTEALTDLWTGAV